jgi:3-oxoacyl-[acyl-carrier-protein] synthase II
MVGARRALSLYGACAGGGLAIGAAMKLIESGKLDVCVAGGADCLLREHDFYHFCGLYAMTTRDCPPDEACCPFDERRDGFVLSEGAGFVVLEAEQHARARVADPLAVVAGFGSTQNAYHIVASPPDGAGPAEAMMAALTDARVAPEDVPYINAHGTSTRDNDVCETIAIRKAFGHHAENLMVSSVKSELGHTMGAAGAIEVALCTKILETGVIPPTINLHQPDPRCDLDYVPHEAREVSVDRVLSNSFGFGGHDAALLLARP